MKEEIFLKEITNQYYPIYIDAIHQKKKYLESDEYLKLLDALKNNVKDNYSKKIFHFLKSKYKIVTDLTSSSFQDRCVNIQVLFRKENKYEVLCINVSLLAPYYIIYLLDIEVDTKNKIWKSLPKRNKIKENKNYLKEIKGISHFLEKELNLNKFSEDFLFRKIPNINFQDIELGNFTFFNAFFINQYSIVLQ